MIFRPDDRVNDSRKIMITVIIVAQNQPDEINLWAFGYSGLHPNSESGWETDRQPTRV